MVRGDRIGWKVRSKARTRQENTQEVDERSIVRLRGNQRRAPCLREGELETRRRHKGGSRGGCQVIRLHELRRLCRSKVVRPAWPERTQRPLGAAPKQPALVKTVGHVKA